MEQNSQSIMNSRAKAKSANPDLQPLLYTMDQAMVMLGLGRTSLYEMLSNGKLKAVKMGRKTLFRRDQLEAFALSLPEAELEDLEDEA